jgi:DNA-directed RNA polymerase specialized sigma24 family protein
MRGGPFLKLKLINQKEMPPIQFREPGFRQEMIAQMSYWATGITKDPVVSFEIAQQVFDEFAEKMDTFKSQQSAKNYLFVATRNQALTWCQNRC